MAKIAKCGYGSDGRGVHPNAPDGYSYVVNDSVKTGDRIQVIATSRAGRKFATTAVPLHTYGENTAKGTAARQEAEDTVGEVTEVKSAKELDVGGSKKTPATLDPDLKDLGQTKPQSQFTMNTRGAALKNYEATHGGQSLTPLAQKEVETFESYSKKFMPKEE